MTAKQAVSVDLLLKPLQDALLRGPMSVDLLLNQQREALLRIARSRREWVDNVRATDPIGPAQDKGDYHEKKLKIGWAGNEMGKFYARGVAEDIEALIPLLDLISDQERRMEAMAVVLRLVAHLHGEAEFLMLKPEEEMLKGLKMENARSRNTERAEQRRKDLRPHLEERARRRPKESVRKILPRGLR